jgi:hypothetical protein
MAEQAQVPIFDYPVLSDHRVNAGRNLAEAEPGQRVFGDEEVRLETGDFEPGDDVLGSVTIEEIPTTRPGQVLFRAVFDFVDKKGPIVITGFLPGEADWNGVTFGAGQGRGRHGSVRVEGRNPKRWG